MKLIHWLGLAAVLSCGAAQAQTALDNGIYVTLNGNQDTTQVFTLFVPAGLSSVEFMTQGGTGDADIYVNYGEPYLTGTDPTPECVSDTEGNVESCEILNPASGVWYVEVYGFAAYANLGLVGVAAKALQDNVALTISGDTDSVQWFYLDVPAGKGKLTTATSGGTGDPDLFMGDDLFGEPGCVSQNEGPVDSCAEGSPTAGRWYALVYGFEAYSGVSLLARTSEPGSGGGGALPVGLLGVLLLAWGLRRRA